MKQCKCGSMAFNLAQEGIDQGDLCDSHYWQDRAERAFALIALCESAITTTTANSPEPYCAITRRVRAEQEEALAAIATYKGEPK